MLFSPDDPFARRPPMNAPLHREMPATLLDSRPCPVRGHGEVGHRHPAPAHRLHRDPVQVARLRQGLVGQHGYLDTVLRNAAAWVEAQKVEGLKLEIVRLPGRTPVLFFEVPRQRHRHASKPC
jgi:hypothetical protein